MARLVGILAFLALAQSVSAAAPSVALMGGGTDQDDAFHWLCQQAGGGSFLVLRASGTDAYNPYVRGLCPEMKNVETLVIASRAEAARQDVIDKIRNASVLFIAGGSQDNYINFWTGTPVQTEINASIARGVPIGGTSAGLAVLAEYNFSALKDTVTSEEALRDPFDARVTIGRGFLNIPYLEGKITDSHFVSRDRMGRNLIFLARIANEGGVPSAIAVDEKTAVLMNKNGSAKVVGKGSAYFLRAPGLAERCTAGVPLTYKNVEVYRVSAGSATFDVSKWIGVGGLAYQISSEAGVLRSTQSNGQVY